jgi:hypothetical protein
MCLKQGYDKAKLNSAKISQLSLKSKDSSCSIEFLVSLKPSNVRNPLFHKKLVNWTTKSKNNPTFEKIIQDQVQLKFWELNCSWIGSENIGYVLFWVEFWNGLG